MGEMSDYYNTSDPTDDMCEIDTPGHLDGWGDYRREQSEQAATRRAGSRTHWRTISGETIRPRDMSDDHLLNTIHMIERRRLFVLCWGALLYEAGRRGLEPDVPEARGVKP